MPEAPSVGLVLASASSARRKLLEAAGVRFRVAPAHIDEPALRRDLAARGAASSTPAAVADALAAAKARAVSASLGGGPLVIGADQVLALDEELLDKPGTMAAARAQLERLRGRAHRLFSAAALAQDGRLLWSTVDRATLTMRPFSDSFLDAYLAEAGADLTGIVGSYEIEGRGVQLFERVEGDHFTIVGLPLIPLLAELRARGMLGT